MFKPIKNNPGNISLPNLPLKEVKGDAQVSSQESQESNVILSQDAQKIISLPNKLRNLLALSDPDFNPENYKKVIEEFDKLKPEEMERTIAIMEGALKAKKEGKLNLDTASPKASPMPKAKEFSPPELEDKNYTFEGNAKERLGQAEKAKTELLTKKTKINDLKKEISRKKDEDLSALKPLEDGKINLVKEKTEKENLLPKITEKDKRKQLEQEISNLEAGIQSKQTEIDKKKEEIKTKEEKLQSLNQKEEKVNQDIRDVEAKIIEYKEEINGPGGNENRTDHPNNFNNFLTILGTFLPFVFTFISMNQFKQNLLGSGSISMPQFPPIAMPNFPSIPSMPPFPSITIPQFPSVPPLPSWPQFPTISMNPPPGIGTPPINPPPGNLQQPLNIFNTGSRFNFKH
ncbi:MAG: hypothetical protein HYU63_06715 [Armatimonadetes bacterium]|nr:hypothetical protein [Armatimonadota bacterium]